MCMHTHTHTHTHIHTQTRTETYTHTHACSASIYALVCLSNYASEWNTAFTYCPMMNYSGIKYRFYSMPILLYLHRYHIYIVQSWFTVLVIYYGHKVKPSFQNQVCLKATQYCASGDLYLSQDTIKINQTLLLALSIKYNMLSKTTCF